MDLGFDFALFFEAVDDVPYLFGFEAGFLFQCGGVNAFFGFCDDVQDSCDSCGLCLPLNSSLQSFFAPFSEPWLWLPSSGFQPGLLLL